MRKTPFEKIACLVPKNSTAHEILTCSEYAPLLISVIVSHIFLTITIDYSLSKTESDCGIQSEKYHILTGEN